MRLNPASTDPWDRAAHLLLAAHLALILFSTLAMVTILAGEIPLLLQGPFAARVYAWGWTYSGQVYILLGAFAALAHTAPRFGTTRALLAAVVATAVALASELGGTNFGVPFGPYHYTEMLGHRILGDVPYAIPVSWYYMLYGSLALCSRILPPDDSARSRWRWALVAGACLTAWDVAMEVQMTNVRPFHWAWDLDRAAGWVPAWLLTPVHHGMPISNWIGWYLTGVVISRLLLAIVPPSVWGLRVAPTALPLVLYAANGVMPVAVTARHGYWAAAAGGALAMGVPLWLALRSGRRVAALGPPWRTP